MNHQTAFTCLCVWEWLYLNDESQNASFQRYKQDYGLCETRDRAIKIGSWIEDAYLKLNSDAFEGMAYDLDIVPSILSEIDFKTSQYKHVQQALLKLITQTEDRVCGTCGSLDIVQDGITRFNNVTKEWELDDLTGTIYCNQCDDECIAITIKQDECLFENFANQPKKLTQILEDFENDYRDGVTIGDLKKLEQNVEAIGYTFDYGLEGEPFNLRLKK